MLKTIYEILEIKLTTPYLELEDIFFDKVKPTPLKKPFLIAASNDAAKLLGIDEDLYNDEHPEYEYLCKSAPSKFKNIKLSCSS